MKQAVEHVPGPWMVEGTAIWQADWRGAATGGKIASVAVSPFSADRNEANARLIAAAPDLLRALEAIIRNGKHSFNDNNGWRPVLTVKMWEDAQAALAMVGVEIECLKSPTGEHVPDWGSMQKVPDLENVCDVWCRYCGASGSLAVEPGDDPDAEDVNW